MDNDTPTTYRPEPYPPTTNVPVSTDDIERACAEQDAAREELRRRLGILDIAVDLIRSGREE